MSRKFSKDGVRIYSFQPIIGKEPRILILGSMPSIRSLEHGQYYAHPRNHFWPLIFKVLNEEDPKEYDKRIDLLKQRHIALWDCIESCERTGSLDSNIVQVILNDIGALLANHVSIQAIFFNGSRAQKEFFRAYQNQTNNLLEYVLLPSSSPVPRKGMITIQDKLPAWMSIQRWL